jgi:hypothetical protein
VTRALVVLIALALSGCGLDLFKPYCDDLGVHPSCTRVNGGWICPTTGDKVCNEDGYAAHSDCGDRGGTYCVVR